MNTSRPMPEAVTFGHYLRSQMKRRGYTTRRLAAELGVSDTLVCTWTHGQYLPRLSVSEQLSILLDDGRLNDMVVRARVRKCAYAPCSNTFERRAGSPRRYCSETCERQMRRKRDYRETKRQEAIETFCKACEPEGICRDADCPLRAFSPFVFIPLN